MIDHMNEGVFACMTAEQKARLLGYPKLDAQIASYLAGYGSPATEKCPACGSHEFRTHNLVRVCSYCRCAA